MEKLFFSFLFVLSVSLISALDNSIFAQTTPLALTSFTTNNTYNPYFNFAVNNAHFLANDNLEHIFVIFVDSIGQLTVMTRENGNWYTQIVDSVDTGEVYKNPTIQWDQGKLHISWFVLSSGSSVIKYAQGIPVTTGIYNWNITSFATIPINGPKYLAMTVPDSAYSPYIGFTEAGDASARMLISSGECSISPMNSGLGLWENSSDITIASDSNIIVVAWEEEWAVSMPKDRLVFTVSYDGGTTWLPAQNLLTSGPTLGGDPSIAIVDSLIYVAYQKPIIGNTADIMVARKLPTMLQFELMYFGTSDTGKVSKGWLPNMDIDKAYPDRIVVSWERTDGAYFNKWEHRVAVAYITNADQQNPTLTLGSETTSSIADTSLYDLNSNIIISPDGQTVSWVWVNVQELSSTSLIMTLFFQEDSINPATDINEINTKQAIAFYPNPTTNIVRFSVPQTDICIYNLQGILVSEYKNETLSIPVDDLPAGMYFVKTTTGTEKFIKTE